MIYFPTLALISFVAWRWGDRETRIASLICVLGSVLSLLLVSQGRGSYKGLEEGVALVDMAVLVAFVTIALRSARFWPLWVSGLQLTTTLAHVLRMIEPDLLNLAYAVALRFWSYPILLIVAVAAVRTRRYTALKVAAA